MSDGEERERHSFLAIDQRCISLSAVPLCRATWSVLSLLISYCGSSLLAWWTYPFESTSFACTLTILPPTRPASDFQLTCSPTLNCSSMRRPGPPLQWRLKYCAARSCFTAAARVLKVPRLRRRPVFGFTLRE